MQIQMFNIWYFFWILISIDLFCILYILLRKKATKQKR